MSFSSIFEKRKVVESLTLSKITFLLPDPRTREVVQLRLCSSTNSQYFLNLIPRDKYFELPFLSGPCFGATNKVKII